MVHKSFEGVSQGCESVPAIALLGVSKHDFIGRMTLNVQIRVVRVD